MTFRLFPVVFVTAFLVPFPAAADTPPQRYNVIELAASAQREIANDLMTVQLFVEASDANPAQLANQLNRAITEGVRISKEYPVVKLRTSNNQTYPVYGRNNQAQGWRGRAELRLETRDFAAGAALTGKLQASLQLAGMQFGVAPETRQKVENELITEVMIVCLSGGLVGCVVPLLVFDRGFELGTGLLVLGKVELPPELLAFVLLISAGLAVVASIIPAWRASRADIATSRS